MFQSPSELVKKVVQPAIFVLRGGKVNRKRAATSQRGPFVYRLGRQVFNLERGVRLPYGLPICLFWFYGIVPCPPIETQGLSNTLHEISRCGLHQYRV